jgi:hypothetical protein
MADTPNMPVDRVQVPSRRKDGTADQSDGYELIGDKETTEAAIAEQLGQMLVSAADDQRAQAQAAAAAEGPQLSAEEQARKDEHDALLEQAKAQAADEVSSRWVDPASRQTQPEEATTRRRRSSTATE